jgi:hypothetical protein
MASSTYIILYNIHVIVCFIITIIINVRACVVARRGVMYDDESNDAVIYICRSKQWSPPLTRWLATAKWWETYTIQSTRSTACRRRSFSVSAPSYTLSNNKQIIITIMPAAATSAAAAAAAGPVHHVIQAMKNW